MWVQDVGDFTVSQNIEEWGSAFSKAYEAETAALKKQAEEAQKKFEEQQKKLTEATPLMGGSK
jgi:cellobiose-specific phosphotransferase system component IIA